MGAIEGGGSATAEPASVPASVGSAAEAVASSGPAAVLVRALLASLLAYVVVNFVLVPGNQLIGFPIHHDDYTNLSHTAIDLHRAWARPVSTVVLMALSVAGPTAFFLTLHTLTVSYVALTLTFLSLLFRVRRPSFALFVALALPPFAFEYIVYYYRYTGLITNLLSVTFGTVALLLLLTGLRDSVSPSPRVAFAVVAFALCILSKEDFILPVVLLCGYLALPGVAPSRGRRLAALTLTVGLSVAAAAWLLYVSLVLRAVFLGTASGPYERVLSPGSIMTTGLWYLKVTIATKAATVIQAAALAVGFLPPLRRYWREQLLAHLLAVSLVLAYAPLPRHVSPYYCFNWLPWQVGCLVVAGRLLGPGSRRLQRAAVSALVLTAALVPVSVTQRQRRWLADWYNAEISTCRNIAATLLANRTVLQGQPVVGIVDPPTHNPWFGTDGSFLATRYGLKPTWLVLVPRDSDFYKGEVGLLGRPGRGRVKTLDVAELAHLPRMPVIRFASDGHGTLTWSPP